MAEHDPRQELARLVELDYERTASFINGVTGTSSTIRGWAVTIWLAVVGLAVDRGEWQFAAAAIVLTGAFYLVDAYHATLYSQALDHAAALERVTGEYYALLGRGADDEEASLEADVALQSHKFGLYRSLKPFKLRDLRFARPTIFFRMFYGLLFLGATALLVLLLNSGRVNGPSCANTNNSKSAAVECPRIYVHNHP